MKKTLLILLMTCMITSVFGQNLNGRVSASLYTFERFDSPHSSNTYVRTFENLSFNLNQDKYSLRTRINFESNIGNSIENEPRWRVYNLYLEARDVLDIATVKLGRQPFISSVGGGVYDALNLKLKIKEYSLSGFYGGNVPAYQRLDVTNNLSENYILGAKFTASALANLMFSLSYVDKSVKNEDYTATRLDVNNSPIQMLIQSKSNEFKYATAEVQYDYSNQIQANVRADYDFNYKTASRLEFGSRLDLVDRLGITLDYSYRAPRIRYNSIFAVFDFANTNEIEVGADYRISKKYTAVAKFANISYDGVSSTRISAGLNSNFGNISYRKNLGESGELDAVSIFVAHSFWEGFLTPSVGLSYTSYKITSETEKNSISSLLLGINHRPSNKFSLDFQVQFSNNRIYKNDTRFLVSVSHWFNSNMSGK